MDDFKARIDQAMAGDEEFQAVTDTMNDALNLREAFFQACDGVFASGPVPGQKGGNIVPPTVPGIPMSGKVKQRLDKISVS